MDNIPDNLTIKNLLFTKAIPNYVIPIPVDNHKVFACTDCGDKFIFESTYNDHINRQSALISYMCRHCNRQKYFYNRCRLLCHIRSHAFKTATINVVDLKIEPLPLSNSMPNEPQESTSKQSASSDTTVNLTNTQLETNTSSSIFCYECKANITVTGVAYKDRASHFMQFSNEIYSCPICLFALPSMCALKVHLRLHLRCPPFFCPECGSHLINKNVQYPYNHDCEGFKMMRATARLCCTEVDCCLFHPNDFREHMKKYHLKKVYKCPFCVVACFSETTMDKHLKGHKTNGKAMLFYQCNVCPGRYVLQNPKFNDQHLRSHINTSIFPCWACGSAFKELTSLLAHFIKQHNKSEAIETALKSILKDTASTASKPKRIYRVVKRCDQCQRSFTYKCKHDEIQDLPNECPFKCSSTMESNVTPERAHINTDISDQIICHLCNVTMSQDWTEIKKHYAEIHKSHKCLDAKIVLTRVDIQKYLSQNANNSASKIFKAKMSKKTKIRQVNKSSNSLSFEEGTSSQNTINQKSENYICNICDKHYEDKSMLEKHIIIHRDPCMAYQCLECGQSFVVKPSFSKHLLLEHNITEVDEYICNKQCYNENALMKHQRQADVNESPIKENQCKICRDQFDNSEDLAKHFRVHGMAFLMKNNSDKYNSS